MNERMRPSLEGRAKHKVRNRGRTQHNCAAAVLAGQLAVIGKGIRSRGGVWSHHLRDSVRIAFPRLDLPPIWVRHHEPLIMPHGR